MQRNLVFVYCCYIYIHHCKIIYACLLDHLELIWIINCLFIYIYAYIYIYISYNDIYYVYKKVILIKRRSIYKDKKLEVENMHFVINNRSLTLLHICTYTEYVKS